MKVEHYLKGNALGLKLHWIYDRKYLKHLSETENLFQLTYDKKHFTHSHPSYDCYPNQVEGDTTSQGVILKHLFLAYEKNKNLTLSDYEAIIKYLFMDLHYDGYQESYIKKYIENKNNNIKNQLEDNHTIYFMPYLVLKDVNKSILLSRLFNVSGGFDADLKLFDRIVWYYQNYDFKFAYKKALEEILSDNVYQLVLEDIDFDTFILKTGQSCQIRHAMPVVYYLMYHHDFKEAMYKNFLIGGSISERAGFLSYLFGIKVSNPFESILR